MQLSGAPDARTSLLCAACLCSLIACLNSLAACAASLILGLVMLALAHPPLAALAARFGAVNFFILFMWLIVPWTTPGQNVCHFGFMSITNEGVLLCLLATLKANAILAIFVALLFRLSMADIASALHSLRCPEKLVWLFLLMERNVALLREEWRKLAEAVKLRGFTPATSMRTYRTIAAMLALLLIGAHARGERMREALLLRGFNGSLPFRRTTALTKTDALLGACTAIAMGVLICVSQAMP